jgi:NAD-dependent DNA ligase
MELQSTLLVSAKLLTSNIYHSHDYTPPVFDEKQTKQIFAGMVFFVEIFQDGASMFDLFLDQIQKMGGKLTKTIGKKTTHLIWKDGRLKSLLKAHDLGIKIVTPLWL